ncbi:MAG: insulinase family protein [Planctomycetes bacterium]|nr:insulinase family protein [Planctomycetota bacterium]
MTFRMRSSPLAGMVLAALFSGSAVLHAEEGSKPMDPFPPSKSTLKTLPNGFTVVVKENHTAPVVAVRAYVKNTGRIREGRYTGSGISHYLEHLVAGGSTTTRSEAENQKILRDIGGGNNAMTTFDHTCYFVNTHRDSAGTVIDLFADWLRNHAFKAEEVAREKETITEEILRADDSQGRAAHELFYRTLFPDHPINIPTIGHLDAFRALTRDDLAAFYRERYIPQNTILVVAGDVRPEEVLEKAEKAFGSWPMGRVVYDPIPPETPPAAPRWVEEEMPSARNCIVFFGFPTVGLTHPDMYPLDLLSLVLSLGRSSRVHARVVERERLARRAGTQSLTPNYGCGVFYGYLAELPYANVRPAVAAVLEEMDRLKAELVTAEELERARTQLIALTVFHKQTAEEQAEDVGGNVLGVHDPDFSDRYLERLRMVTAEELRRAARAWFDRSRLVVAVVKPREDAATGATPKAPGAAESAAGTVKITLANGLRVVVQRNTSSPIVCLQAFCRAGLPAEPAGKNGINNLAATLLTSGTATRTLAEIHRGLEVVGTTVEATGGNNTIGLKMQALREGLDASFAIFADILLHPSFPPEEVEKVKKMTVWTIQRNRADAEDDAQRVYRSRYWQTHPYRRTTEGTPEEIAAITPQEVASYYRSLFVPSNVVVAVFGDVTVEKAKALAEAHFASWAEPPSFAAPAAAAEAPRAAPESADEPCDFKTVQIFVGYPAPAMTDADRFAFSLFHYVVSGGSGNWVHEALRGKEEGLVYSAGGSFWPGVNTGTYYVYAQTAPEKAERVLALVREVLARAAAKGISAEDLETAKHAFLVGEALGQQTLSGQAQWTALSELYGQGYDFPAKYLDLVKAVTLEDVNRMAVAYLKNPLVLRLVPKKKPEGPK